MLNSHPIAVLSGMLLLLVCGYSQATTPQVEVESNQYLCLVFMEHPKAQDFDKNAAMSVDNYTISSKDDPAYAQDRKPVKVGRDSYLDDFEPINWPYRIGTVKHRLILQLDRPIQPGKTYVVTVNPSVTPKDAGKSFNYRFDEGKTLNHNIKVNQVGYLPQAGTKIAYLGGYLGSLGPLPLSHVTEFHLVDAKTGKSVLQGKPVLSRKDDPDSGEDVYVLDFSSFRKPGEYYITVPGMGRSYAFRIADDVYADVFKTTARGLFHQRCGIALTKPYTTFTHGKCHTQKALLTTADGDSDNLKRLPGMVIPGKVIDGWGGWHDAADYDRRGIHIDVPKKLLTLYEIAPNKFYDNQLNLPESGNGVPDILDEACWGLDWFLRMQDKQDGGVHYRIDSGDFAFHIAPEKDTQKLYAYAKDTTTTILFAGTAAQASRVCRPFSPKKADAYLKAAEMAWAYGTTHLKKEEKRQMEALSYAAAELFKTTGKNEYHDTFKKTTVSYGACWTYATCDQKATDAALKKQCRGRVIGQANKYAKNQAEEGYRRSYRREPSWGSGANTPRYVVDLIQGYVLSEDKKLYDAALCNLDHQLGANPLNMTWITGLGDNPPSAVAHNPSHVDGIEEPVPGIPIYGYARMYGASAKAKLYWSVLFPGKDGQYVSDGKQSNYPMMRRWSPVERIYIMNEFTIHENMGPAIFSYGFFCPEKASPVE